VPTGLGGTTIPVTATRGRSTGYAQVAVDNVALPGTKVLDVDDPSGDDNGPGTYAYPTNSVFVRGAFDVTHLRVSQTGTDVYIQVTIRNLVNTFGSDFGAQLLDVYVHSPGAGSTSTSAAYSNMNYAVAAPDAWSQRLEAQGFVPPIWVDAANTARGTPQLVFDDAAGTALLILPQSTFGTPGPGWVFTVALTGQGADQPPDRAFTQPAQDFTFGVCGSGVSSPICALDPNSVPKVIDTIPPAGVNQATELDPTRGPVQLQGVSP
jgi:glucoamylase